MWMHTWLRSSRHAARGIAFIFRNEKNFQIECGAAIAALILAACLPLSSIEWVLLLLVIGLVLTIEMINTAIERILDIIKPNVHPYVRVVKDIAAGAVLFASIISVVIGMCIFLPYLL